MGFWKMKVVSHWVKPIFPSKDTFYHHDSISHDNARGSASKWTQPTQPTRPEFWPWGPTRPDSTRVWTLRARPENGSGWVQIRFIKYIIGLNPNLNPFRGQPDPIGPVFGSWGPTLTHLNPKIGPKIGLNPKKRVGFGRTSPGEIELSHRNILIWILRELRILYFWGMFCNCSP